MQPKKSKSKEIFIIKITANNFDIFFALKWIFPVKLLKNIKLQQCLRLKDI